MAFVSSFGPVALRSAFSGTAVCSGVKATTVKVSMAMSKSVPFLEKPPRLEGLPASAEFDPLGLSNYVDPRFLAEAEIKHGRICMLAALGMLVQEQFTFPTPYFPKMLPIDAHNVYIQTGGMAQIMIAIIVFEAFSCYALKETMEGKRAPGDFGFDPLGLGKDPAKYKTFQENEIRNGRLAMIGVGGMITQMQVYHQGPIDQLLHFKPMLL